MRRGICLSTLTLLGVVLAVATDDAQQSRARIRVHEVADNLHMLGSGPAVQGPVGNTALFVTATGVVLVDTKVVGYGPDILAEVHRITDKPVTDDHQHPHPLRSHRQQHRVPRLRW